MEHCLWVFLQHNPQHGSHIVPAAIGAGTQQVRNHGLHSAHTAAVLESNIKVQETPFLCVMYCIVDAASAILCALAADKARHVITTGKAAIGHATKE